MDFSKVILMTDLDGTLLTDDKQILPVDLEAIDRFRAGGKFVQAQIHGVRAVGESGESRIQFAGGGKQFNHYTLLF